MRPCEYPGNVARSSIPEIEVADMEAFEVVRLDSSIELTVHALARKAAEARAAADLREREIAADAGAIIEKFISHAVHA